MVAALLAFASAGVPSIGTAAIYDGSQSNNVVRLPFRGGTRATLSFRVQTPADENPSYVMLAECGKMTDVNSFRVTFNGRRERRVCGCYGETRVDSGPCALDDGRLHHVALEIEPGRRLTLHVDGRPVDSAVIPDLGLAVGPLALAQRVMTGTSDDAWYVENLLWSRFRGRISDVSLTSSAFDAAQVPGGTAPQDVALALPPDPFAAEPKWERPKTTRRYLQGPFSERLLTFWREGKIACGEIDHRDDWSINYRNDVRAHAAWLRHGAEDEPFDFRAAAMSQPDGGEPEHAQTWRMGPLIVELAACAPFGRRPSAYARLSVRNVGDRAVTEPFAFLLRAGLESSLLFGAPDVYRIFRPDRSDWDAIPPGEWRREGDVMWQGDRFAAFAGAPFAWDPAKGAVRIRLDVAPGESRTVEMELGKGVRRNLGYGAARQSMYAGWRAEMAKLRVPAGMSAEDRRIVRNLAVQMLQCLSLPTEGDFTLPRQGGLQRYVWPGDEVSAAEALDAIGFGEYVARIVDFYFTRCQRANGEMGPFRNRWAADTASVLVTFARHCVRTGDETLWRRWRDAALRAFGWIEGKRAEGDGLFPPMKATDHRAVFRAWGATDLPSLQACETLAKAAATFGDPCADRISAAARSYRETINKALDGWRAKSAGKDELFIPLAVDGNDDPLSEAFVSRMQTSCFVAMGFLSPDEMHRLWTWLVRHGYANANGLCSNNLSRDPACRHHVWYTTWGERNWFLGWKRAGRDDLAARAVDVCLRYALTDELYVGERYHDANVWFYPWSPNASGAGRIVMMLLER